MVLMVDSSSELLAGFTEKAMGIQAQSVSIGAVICAPTLRAFPLITELSNIPRISELEEFWNSKMARIGEEGAEGWGKWYASGKPEISASCGVELAKPNVVLLDPDCQWSFNETQRDHSSLLPAKSSDQVADINLPYLK